MLWPWIGSSTIRRSTARQMESIVISGKAVIASIAAHVV